MSIPTVFTPTAGPVALMKILVGTGTPVATIVPGINWKLNNDGKLKDVSNFQTGRQPAATLADADLSFTLVLDQANLPNLPTGFNIKAGSTFTAQLYVDGTRFYTGTFMTATDTPSVDGMEDVIMVPVTAKVIGTITYPAGS
jgi:hypothetical protein